MGLYGNITENKLLSFQNTTMCKITIGTCAGYNNDKEEIDDFEKYLYNKLEEISQNLGYYISFVVYKTKTIYKKDWGCPENGEKTYNLEATRNPEFNHDDNLWRSQVIEIIKILKKELKQTTVTIQFFNTDIIYLKGEN